MNSRDHIVRYIKKLWFSNPLLLCYKVFPGFIRICDFGIRANGIILKWSRGNGTMGSPKLIFRSNIHSSPHHIYCWWKSYWQGIFEIFVTLKIISQYYFPPSSASDRKPFSLPSHPSGVPSSLSLVHIPIIILMTIWDKGPIFVFLFPIFSFCWNTHYPSCLPRPLQLL